MGLSWSVKDPPCGCRAVGKGREGMGLGLSVCSPCQRTCCCYACQHEPPTPHRRCAVHEAVCIRHATGGADDTRTELEPSAAVPIAATLLAWHRTAPHGMAWHGMAPHDSAHYITRTCPSNTSGATHCSVPTRVAALVALSSRDSPKSAIQTEPSTLSRQLDDFRSRCMILGERECR